MAKPLIRLADAHFPNCDDEDIGTRWDFNYEEIDDILFVLNGLKEIEAELYVETTD